MTAVGTLALAFVCVPMQGARLLRSGCVARYTAAMREARAGEPSLRYPTCRGCVTGKAHAAGKKPRTWPDGSSIVEIRLASSGTLHEPTTAKPRARVGKSKGPGVVSPAETVAPIPVIAPPVVPSRPEKPPAVEPRAIARPRPVAAVKAPARAARGTVQKGAVERPTERRDPVPVPGERRRAGKAPRWIEVDGIRDSVGGWARRLGVAHTVIAERLRRGWSEALAVTMPKGSGIAQRTVVPAAAPIPLDALDLSRALSALRALGFEVERVGSTSRGDVLVVRTTTEVDHASDES